MNPMTNVKNIKKLSDQELRRSLKTSWHDQYKDSAWIFVGGLPYDLTEGDIICVFSQFGEIVNLNLVRDKGSGKPKGFCFLCYEDQRSTVLAVDNFNGMKLLGRTLRVDHVQDYKPPKDSEKKDAETRRLQEEGCAPSIRMSNVKKEPEVKKENPVDKDDCLIIEKAPSVVDLVSNRPGKDIKSEPKTKKKKKESKVSKEKEKKELDKKKKKKTRRRNSSSSSSSSSNASSESSDSSSSESSSSESESSDEKERAKRRKHKQVKKKKPKRPDVEPQDNETSASSKRRKLEEKIKALEKELAMRSGRVKQE